MSKLTIISALLLTSSRIILAAPVLNSRADAINLPGGVSGVPTGTTDPVDLVDAITCEIFGMKLADPQEALGRAQSGALQPPLSCNCGVAEFTSLIQQCISSGSRHSKFAARPKHDTSALGAHRQASTYQAFDGPPSTAPGNNVVDATPQAASQAQATSDNSNQTNGPNDNSGSEPSGSTDNSSEESTNPTAETSSRVATADDNNSAVPTSDQMDGNTNGETGAPNSASSSVDSNNSNASSGQSVPTSDDAVSSTPADNNNPAPPSDTNASQGEPFNPLDNKADNADNSNANSDQDVPTTDGTVSSAPADDSTPSESTASPGEPFNSSEADNADNAADSTNEDESTAASSNSNTASNDQSPAPQSAALNDVPSSNNGFSKFGTSGRPAHPSGSDHRHPQGSDRSRPSSGHCDGVACVTQDFGLPGTNAPNLTGLPVSTLTSAGGPLLGGMGSCPSGDLALCLDAGTGSRK